MNLIFLKVISVVLLSLIFLYAGVITLFNFTAVNVKLYDNRLMQMMPYQVSQILLILALGICIIGPLLMLIGVGENNKLLVKIGAGLLIGLLVLTTLLFLSLHNQNEVIDVLKNLALIGGLTFVLTH
jgi:uncharacterized membrane protein YphA (DoxX/SURF4 family)